MNNKKLLEGFSFEDVIKESEKIDSKESNIETGKKNSRTEIDYQIKTIYGSLSERKMAPIFSLVNWNGYDRFDLRPWRGNMSSPGKGVTFTKEEIDRLQTRLRSFNFEVPDSRAKPRSVFQTPKATAKLYDSICVVSENEGKGQLWKKEVQWIDWGHGIKVDIRKWSEDYQKCSRGLTMTAREFESFYKMICSL